MDGPPLPLICDGDRCESLQVPSSPDRPRQATCNPVCPVVHHPTLSESLSELGVQLEPGPIFSSLSPKPFIVETETLAQELMTPPCVDLVQDEGQSWLIPLAAGAVPLNYLLSQPLSSDPQPETVGELAASNATESGTGNCDITPKPPNQEETIETLLESNKEGLSTEQQQRLWDLLYEFKSIFATSPSDLGRTHLIQHEMDTGTAHPIRQRPRRIPLNKQAAAEQCVAEMRAAGVIEPSNSSWVSPVVMVPKKGAQGWRFCVDFRPVNEITVKDSYPLPRVNDALDGIRGSAWFSSLDLRSGYWQVPLSPEARPKTAFTTGSGLWQFTVMPFGLCNAPATFERLMEKVLMDVPSQSKQVYLDDVLIHGPDFDIALQALRMAFSKIQQAGLKLNPEKCRLMRKELTFLGHKVSAQGVSTVEDKVIAVRDWPVPKNVSEVRSFLGLASYYRRFIAGFSTAAAPLNQLTCKNVRFEWGPEQEQAFDALKSALCHSPVLTTPDPAGQFVLDTDASNDGLGAVLAQVTPQGEQVIAYYSRAFSKPERNYCVTRRELLAVVESVNHFKHYLCGVKFVVRTDHASLG